MVNQSNNSRGFPAITGLNSFFLKKTEQLNQIDVSQNASFSQ